MPSFVENIGDYNLVYSQYSETRHEIELFLDWKKINKFELNNHAEAVEKYNSLKDYLNQIKLLNAK